MASTQRRRRSTAAFSFDDACSMIETAVAGPLRRQIVDDVSRSADLASSLLRLRDRMRTNVWNADAGRVDLAAVVAEYDSRTRDDGFHALHDWDGVAAQVNPDIIPVDVLHYIVEQRRGEAADPAAAAILLDYYFFHVLSLLSLRAWDDGDPDANLGRLDGLLQQLQGADGSGQQFCDDAETLILIATSHYEANELGYDRLLERVRSLNCAHQVKIALAHASSMGCHLRFGFEATYGRDIGRMRSDNVADYPWLCYALATLMEEYARLRGQGAAARDREVVAEGLLNGLSADTGAFVCDPPASPAPYEAERAEFCRLFRSHRHELLEEFEGRRPSEQLYSPLSFFFNFSHNVVKGTVIDALIWSQGWTVTFNDLLSAMPIDPRTSQRKETLAKTLMGYARANPHRIRGRLMPVIVYDPGAGHQAFSLALRKARE